MNPQVNSGTFLTLRPSSNSASLLVDGEGHDSPEEISAALKLDEYAHGTGNMGGGGTVVEAFGKNMRTVLAWINPEDTHAVMVRITPNETIWAETNVYHPNADEDPKLLWMSLDEGADKPSRRHAAAVDRIVREVFSRQMTRDVQ